jgi:hypothetical protein
MEGLCRLSHLLSVICYFLWKLTKQYVCYMQTYKLKLIHTFYEDMLWFSRVMMIIRWRFLFSLFMFSKWSRASSWIGLCSETWTPFVSHPAQTRSLHTSVSIQQDPDVKKNHMKFNPIVETEPHHSL